MEQVTKCLKQLTTSYRITVIASIHSPNNETLSLFDSVYVMAKGGAVIYSRSPLGIQHWLSKEVDLQVRAEQPPIEALMKLACNGK